ncbi:MAG: aminotransferase class I/II-fold pyridoxal phosphate-dependent enzyme, partial [Actinomycetota bacterium]
MRASRPSEPVRSTDIVIGLGPHDRQDDRCSALGGPPAFDRPLHVGRPNVGDRALLQRRLDSILDARWFSNNGPVVQEFEAAIRDVTGAQHAVATSSGTSARELAVRALGLAGRVIVPSFTFVATAHALSWLGVEPLFCDIDDSYTIDPRAVERALDDDVSAIIGVHVWGHPCDVDALGAIGRSAGIP